MGVPLELGASGYQDVHEIISLGRVPFAMSPIQPASRHHTDPRGYSPEQERAVPRPPDAAADRAVATLLDLIAKRHTLDLLYVFARDPGPWRYNHLEEALSIPQNSLTRRLADLVEAGLLDRTAYAEVPLRVEYTATDRAEALKPVFTRLYEWSHSVAGTEPDDTEGRQ